MNNDTLSICINATIQQPPHAAPYLGSGATIDGNYCGVRSFAILSKIWTIERDKQICNLYIYIYIYIYGEEEGGCIITWAQVSFNNHNTWGALVTIHLNLNLNSCCTP